MCHPLAVAIDHHGLQISNFPLISISCQKPLDRSQYIAEIVVFTVFCVPLPRCDKLVCLARACALWYSRSSNPGLPRRGYLKTVHIAACIPPMSHYKLTYFGFRGRAETARQILAVADVPFDDVRISQEEWAKLKPSKNFHKRVFQKLNSAKSPCSKLTGLSSPSPKPSIVSSRGSLGWPARGTSRRPLWTPMPSCFATIATRSCRSTR